MDIMQWMSSSPMVLDNKGFEWNQARFIYFFALLIEEANAIFFGCNF